MKIYDDGNNDNKEIMQKIKLDVCNYVGYRMLKCIWIILQDRPQYFLKATMMKYNFAYLILLKI